MAKEYVFNWQTAVPEPLLTGAYFDRYEEETGLVEANCLFRVDEYGFYIYWTVEGKETQVIDLAQVSEARYGGIAKDSKVALVQELEGKGPIEDRAFMIVSGLDFVNLNFLRLIAQDAETAKMWIEGLRKITHNFRGNHVCPLTCLMKHWKMLCLNVNEKRKIPVRSILKTFASGKTEKIVMSCLVEIGLCTGKNDEIEPVDFTFDRFCELLGKICPRSDITDLFNNLAGGTNFLTVDQLIYFLNEKQRDPRLNEILFPFFDRPRVLQLINKWEKNPSFVEAERMSVDGFLRYLMSDENAPVHLDRIELYQDMDQPLAHYYINSSHNTYLIGRQFGGRSSVEIYRQVLLSGCRCIEIDCWDGTTGEGKGEPIVTHGKAMCTDVLFKDVIVAIKETAFVTSDCAVILSFENHCCKSNQLKMAKYCTETFGDLLLTKPLEGYALEAGVPLPSPNLLKRKILIKNKRLKPEVEKAQLEQFLREGKLDEPDEETEDPETAVVGEIDGVIDEDNDDDDDEGDDNGEMTPSAAKRLIIGKGIPPSMLGLVVEEAHPELKSKTDLLDATAFKSKLKSLMNKEPTLSKEEEERLLENYKYTGATTTIHPYLSSLVNYTHPVKFQGFDISEQANMHFHMSSFSESAGLGYLKASAIEFVNYNKRQLSRIYPKGGRVDSSNYLPQIFWNAGCQMVSLNFQTPDLSMQINQGKFEYNGSCGYLLKPDFMRRPDRIFDPFSESPVDGVIAAYCSVQVISGQFLSDRRVGTYVEVEMYGLPTDTIRKEFRTRTVPNNGLNPTYSDDPFVFRKVVLPDLAVLRFAVYEENGKLLGQRILPLDGLQGGYRHISLRTETNCTSTLPTIFCNILLKSYVPEGLGGLVDALADPRGYLKSRDQEKQREKQMEAYGIHTEDIAEVLPSAKKGTVAIRSVNSVVSVGGGSAASVSSNSSNSTSNAQAAAKDEKMAFEPVTVESLRRDKTFLKLQKKHQKDMEELQKRHLKEKNSIQRLQCSTIDKVVAEHDKQKTQEEKQLRKKGSFTFGEKSPTSDQMDILSCPQKGDKVKAMVALQTTEWSQMLRKHMEIEHSLFKQQCKEEGDLLSRLLTQAHEAQIQELQQKHEVEAKDLRQVQTKKSMEESRKILCDKSVKTKAERDRRIKEQQEKNLKSFLEERKRLANRQANIVEQLKKAHIEQKDILDRETKKALELKDQMYQEAILASKPETVI